MSNTSHELTVTISERPLGVRFCHFNDNQQQTVAILQQVLIDSHALQIGLSAGDTLSAVNNKSVSKLKPDEALQIFREQSLPFNATFNRQIELIEDSDEDEIIYIDDEDSLWTSYINSPSPLPSLPFLHNTYLADCSDKSTSNPFAFFSKSVSPSKSVSQSTSESTKTADNFIFIDDNDIVEYNYIDKCTKNLVTGFLRNLQSSPTNTAESKPNLIEILTARYVFNNSVLFDNRVEKWMPDAENMKVMTASSNGFKYGIHEWSIQILKCDVYRQEIGIIENFDDLQNIICSKGGVSNYTSAGARAVYGNELCSGAHYYASYNDNGNVRCSKHINKKIGWTTGDVLKIVLNLAKGSIQFYLNNEKVRKKISLQKGKTYYPFVAFSGNCGYEVIDFV